MLSVNNINKMNPKTFCVVFSAKIRDKIRIADPQVSGVAQWKNVGL